LTPVRGLSISLCLVGEFDHRRNFLENLVAFGWTPA
jgi:hypothetical protein